MINPKEALKIVLDNALRPKAVEVRIGESLGLISAENVKSEINVPAFNNSAMDGFAVLASDLAKTPKELQVVDEVPAGKTSDKKLDYGQSIKIMTGAPIPKGANCVVPVEDTSVGSGLKPSPTTITINKTYPKGANIRLAGEDISIGDAVIVQGTKISPVHIGLLASLGLADIKIYQPPTVAILSTGSELTDLDTVSAPGQINDSNSWTLASLVAQLGAYPERIGIAKDDFEETKAMIELGLKSDILITSGGVSVGEYDFVKDVLKDLGATQLFWSVAQKPGKPLAYWMVGGKPVFGLPGNPVAVMMCFELYVRPLILKTMGFKQLQRPLVKAKLAKDIKKKTGRYNYIRVSLKIKEGQVHAIPTGPQGSGILSSMVADGLVVANKDVGKLPAGQTVEVMLLKPWEEIC
ncbi:MAG: molybdopterin molybdenumtransferase MoeA [Actinobacteria bacterium]|nr:MAG: molybdopterin molybdenumtransferase MoeA [Actinomycetota bacterium]